MIRNVLLPLAIATLMQCQPSETHAQAATPPNNVPANAKLVPSLCNDGCRVYGESQTLWLVPTEQAIEARKLSIPRLCAPIRSLAWNLDAAPKLKFVPEPVHWVFSWKEPTQPDAVIQVVFDSDPILPGENQPAKPAGDGSVMLFAHQATTYGEKLRYEPQWYKNTVGYWAVQTDYATWDLEFDSAGEYSVAVLQGCGKGQGGSEATLTLHQSDKVVAELAFQTVDTGHFQNFRWNHLGLISVTKPGSYQLRITPKKIAKVALFDVRTIHLVKQAK